MHDVTHRRLSLSLLRLSRFAFRAPSFRGKALRDLEVAT